jgi:glycogen operon protein
MLRRGRFLTGEFDEELGVKDVTWLTPSGDEMQPSTGTTPMVAAWGSCWMAAPRRLASASGTDSTLLLIMNAHHDVVEFTLPEAVGGSRWVRLLDTNQGQNDDLHEFAFGDTYEVTGRSFLLFILKPARQRGNLTDADRSFQHVLDAFETAISTPVAFPRKSLLSMLNLPPA